MFSSKSNNNRITTTTRIVDVVVVAILHAFVSFFAINNWTYKIFFIMWSYFSIFMIGLSCLNNLVVFIFVDCISITFSFQFCEVWNILSSLIRFFVQFSYLIFLVFFMQQYHLDHISITNTHADYIFIWSHNIIGINCHYWMIRGFNHSNQFSITFCVDIQDTVSRFICCQRLLLWLWPYALFQQPLPIDPVRYHSWFHWQSHNLGKREQRKLLHFLLRWQFQQHF